MADADPKIRMETAAPQSPSPDAAASPAIGPATGMSLRRKLLLAGLAAALLIGGGFKLYDWLTVGRFTQSTDNAYIEADISILSPKVQGYVREVLVADNQLVAAGDIVARIDDADYRAKLAQAEAAVTTRRAAIDNVTANATRQQSAIAAARAEIDSKQAERSRAGADLRRFEALRKDGWASQQRLQTVEADAQKARADYDSAAAGLSSQRAQLNVLSSQAKVALASYKETLAAVDVARLDVENAVLRAPIAGVVGNRALRVGQYVRPGTILMAIVPLRDVYVMANFKETQLADIRVGQKVQLHIDAYEDQAIEGVVESISPAAGSRFSILPPENATGNFTKIVQRLPVKIRLQAIPAGMRLTPGLSVEASINTRQ
jgi:membrane fusion protein, multidrug efflux system